MAIHQEVVREGSEGIIKQIEMSALAMIFDNVQKTQYEHPERSTIRELVSNSVDAVNEKISALAIIKGKAKPEDYYLTRDEPLFADSNYMPEYYEEQWLEKHDNKVYIVLEEAKPGVARDTLRIIDKGVGIGHVVNPKTGQSRLQGVLKLGYSTKRNSSIPIGKFGIGAKAALSTGIDSYTMITRHNGKEYHFEIYDYQAQPSVPRMNMKTGALNPTFTFVDKATGKMDHGHYLETTQKNGTEIIVKTKRHHRQTFINAVQSQLLYFKGIDFKVVRESGAVENIPVMADIKYEDDFIILAKNTQFSKPHFVLNGVNYGYINFQELELEDRIGSIAYKIKPESVTIKASRESLVWDDVTRETVLAVQNKVVDIVSGMIAKELKEDDLIRWIRKCTIALGSSRDSSTIIGELAGYVEKGSLKPVFEPYPSIKYTPDPEVFFLGMEMIDVTLDSVFSKAKNAHVNKIKREKIKSWGLINKPIYLQTEGTSNKLETYLLGIHPDGFIKLKVRDVRMSYQEADDLTELEVKEFKKLQTDTDYYEKWQRDQQVFMKFLKESAETISYESVELPKEVRDKPEDDDDAEVKIKSMSPADLRAIEGKVLCTFPQFYPHYDGYSREFSWGKTEQVIKNILLDEGTVVYGFAEDEELIQAVASMLTKGDYRNGGTEFYTKDFKLVRIAMTAAKHFKNHIYIKDFILSIDPNTKTVAMHSKLVNWHTGRKIDLVLRRMRFLNNYQRFDAKIAGMYNELVNFRNLHFRDVSQLGIKFGASSDMMSDLNSYADKVMELQLYIASHPDDHVAIAAQAKHLFETEEGEETFTNAVGVNLPVYQNLQEVLAYIEPLEHIFNYIENLTDSGESITPELEYEINEILKNKGIARQ